MIRINMVKIYMLNLLLTISPVFISMFYLQLFISTSAFSAKMELLHLSKITSVKLTLGMIGP